MPCFTWSRLVSLRRELHDRTYGDSASSSPALAVATDLAEAGGARKLAGIPKNLPSSWSSHRHS